MVAALMNFRLLQVMVWKLGSRVSTSLQMDKNFENSISMSASGEKITDHALYPVAPSMLIEESPPLERFVGHEGSIYRIAWSEDGFHLASVSDDRSARVWTLGFSKGQYYGSASTEGENGIVIYGHTARIWDCHIDQRLLITASEDCTCRIWTSDGKLLGSLKGHIGRGVWRCIYDAETRILVTAGADASIKVFSLLKWAQKSGNYGRDINHIEQPNSISLDSEVFKFSLGGAELYGKKKKSFLNSKSEYVRCLALADPSFLYIATNHGFIYAVEITLKGSEQWYVLKDGNGHVPFVCMNVLVASSWAQSKEDWIVAGDGKGKVMVLVNSRGSQSEATLHCVWSAEEERQLLGVFWCKCLGSRYVFTTDPSGWLRWWYLKDIFPELRNVTIDLSQPQKLVPKSSVEHESFFNRAPILLAICKSELNSRIVCLDVSVDVQVIVCGDQHGNLVLFKIPCSLFQQTENISETIQLTSEVVFKGAHGISAVASLSLISMSSDKQIKLCSTGRDGCICKFMYKRHSTNEVKEEALVCIGVEKVAAITVVESLEFFQGGTMGRKDRRVATGFAAGDFVIWDLTSEIEVAKIPCGGWRRPHSYLIAEACKLQHCFAYTKDQMIFLHRSWTFRPLCDASPHPAEKIEATPSLFSVFPSQRTTHALQKQFHGKEIHCAQFVPVQTAHGLASSESWIITGSEDGTVRVTRCSEDIEGQLEAVMSFGEHVCGSAVRAITLVSEVHTFTQSSHFSVMEKEMSLSIEATHSGSKPLWLLLSVGAKEVMTCWMLEWITKLDKKQRHNLSPRNFSSQVGNQSGVSDGHVYKLASTWLSSHIPLRSSEPSMCATKHQAGNIRHSTNQASPVVAPELHYNSVIEKKDIDLLQASVDPTEHSKASPSVETKLANKMHFSGMAGSTDLRYLSATAFSTRCTKTGLVICFVVAASSNATLSMHAFDISTRFWFKVAVLEYHSAPVLVVQHIVIPHPHSASTAGPFQKFVMVLSGATDGSIAVWDVTHIVISFMSSHHGPSLSSVVPPPLRPFTGRGSQGGKRWSSSRKTSAPLQGQRQSVTQKASKAASEAVKFDGNRLHGCKQAEELCTDSQPEKDDMERDTNPLQNYTDFSIKHQNEFKQVTELLTPERNVVSVVRPGHIFNNAHQSGVNCMSVSSFKSEKQSYPAKAGLCLSLVSGGDDQSLHVATFTVQSNFEEHDLIISSTELLQDDAEVDSLKQNLQSGYQMTNNCAEREQGFTHQNVKAYSKINEEIPVKPSFKLLVMNQHILHGAHNSAIKGVWTDGKIVFSTGLDQRLRGWYLQPFDSSKALVECSNCIIDVPEAAALAVEFRLDREYYRIAVVGRGLQIVDFYKVHGI